MPVPVQIRFNTTNVMSTLPSYSNKSPEPTNDDTIIASSQPNTSTDRLQTSSNNNTTEHASNDVVLESPTLSLRNGINTQEEDEIIAVSIPSEKDLLVFGLSYCDYSMEPDNMNQSERNAMVSMFTNRDQGKQLYNHFNAMAANVLRTIVAKCGNGRSRSNKFGNILGILHRIAKACREQNKSAFDVLRCDDVLKTYISEEKLKYIEEIPKRKKKTHTSSRKCLNSKRKPEEDERSKQPSFTCDEFARLILLLRDDEDIREALSEMAKGLNREAIDAKVKSKHIWNGIIEKQFNSIEVKPVQFIPGLRLNPQNIPVGYRDGCYLYSMYMRSRASFSISYQKWNRSGHRNTDPEWFKNFLTRNSEDELTTDAKRSYILFILLRIGKENEVSELVAIVDKGLDTIEGIGYEEGADNEHDEGNADNKRKKESSGCSSSKKSRSASLTTAQILDAALSSEGAAEKKLNLARTASVTQEIEQRKINSMFENIKVFKQSKEMQQVEEDENVKNMLINTCNSILKLHSNPNSE